MTRILIVEDSPTQAERLRLVLEEANFEAEVAGDGEAALARLAAAPFDLVISDILMPGLSGYELCRRIKAEPAWKGLPVVLLTTRKDPMDIIRGLECGADNFHTKPYDAERLVERIRNVLYNRALRSEERLKVGVEIAFFGRTFAITSEKQQILGLLIATFEDIVQTNQELEKSRDALAAANAKIEDYSRLLEGRVRSSEELHRAIVEGVADGIVTMDANGVIGSFNPAAERIFGYRADEVVGRNVTCLMPEAYRTPHRQSVSAYLRTGSSGIIGKGPREAKGLRKDGTVFPMLIGVSEVALDGRRMFVGAVQDITVRQQTEQQLRQAQKMDAVGQLAGGMAHDFNNLLTVVIGNLELLDDALPSEGPARRLSGAALRAAERGAELTRRLLAFSRRTVLESKECDIGRLVLGIESMLKRTLGEAIEIQTIVPSGEWPTRIDEAQFETALLNLALNARDAMSDNGKLTIEIDRSYLDHDYAARHADLQPGDYVMVAVSDTGAGIPNDLLERVFEPFFTTKDESKGTGLGLSMVYGFIKQSGGHVNIYSEEGHGTTVRMYLPLLHNRDLSSGDTEAAAAEPLTTGAVTVLIVDDKDDVRQTGMSVLEQLNCRVLAAADAAEALELLERHPEIDVLFTDMVMPGGMNGVALAAEAKRRWPKLRVLFCSGFADAAALNGHGLGDGSVFVHKPYRRAELAQKLTQVLKASEPGGPS